MYLPHMGLLVFGFVCLDFFALFCDGFIKLTGLFTECFSPVRRIFMACFHEPQNGNNTTGNVEDVKAKIRIGLTGYTCNVKQSRYKERQSSASNGDPH